MKIKQRKFFQLIVLFFSYFILFAIILNLYLSLYETQEKLESLNAKQNALHSFFNKFTNISYPIAYSLKFYQNYSDMPTIYIITPTYKRSTQLAELTRLKNTLWLVPKIFWIVIEDANEKTLKVEKFLRYSMIQFIHLNSETPEDLKIRAGDLPWSKPRGTFQRNKALEWLRENTSQLGKGVVYFADDDNSYDIKVFEEMRSTKRVSVWPVAFVGELLYERPICLNGKVIDWFRVWNRKRPFPLDMAGFAINLNLLLQHPSARFSHLSTNGMQESDFLSHLVSKTGLECKAENSTKIYVWHTQTKVPLQAGEKYLSTYNFSYETSILDEL